MNEVDRKLHNELSEIYDKRLKEKKGEYDLFDLAFDVYKELAEAKRCERFAIIECALYKMKLQELADWAAKNAVKYIREAGASHDTYTYIDDAFEKDLKKRAKIIK